MREHLVWLPILLWACSAETAPSTPVATLEVPKESKVSESADILSVSVTGEAGAYQFSVSVSSPDTGCEQYADWWEVLSEDGGLIYRRTLLHSHVGEQPFIRGGGPVGVDPEAVIVLRAHMHPGGYGGALLKGSVEAGFAVWDPAGEFAPDVEHLPPQPPDCAF